jgi:fibronectin type 3 domain-containing protein
MQEKKLTRLIKIISIAYLVVFFSGCIQQNLIKPTKIQIDETLEVINSKSVKHISTMSDVALEWQRVNDTRAQGYYIYRGDIKTNNKLQRIKTIKNRYASHFLDSKLKLNSKYLYAVSTIGNNGFESRPSKTIMVQTMPAQKSVSFIATISNLPQQIKIVWRPHSNRAVKSYIVQRLVQKTSTWTNIATLKGRLNAEYIDTKLASNTVYMYRLIAVTFKYIKSLPSKVVQAKTKPLPIGVQELHATIDLAKKIIVKWEPSPTNDIVSYNIYRSTKNTNFELFDNINVKNTIYTDLINKDGAALFYKITAVDKDGLESNRKTNTIRGTTLSKPAKPIFESATIKGKKAILEWSPSDKRAVSYNIIKTVRSGYFSKKKSVVKNVKTVELRFEDTEILPGIIYEYAIEAVDINGIVSERTTSTSVSLPKISN